MRLAYCILYFLSLQLLEIWFIYVDMLPLAIKLPESSLDHQLYYILVTSVRTSEESTSHYIVFVRCSGFTGILIGTDCNSENCVHTQKLKRHAARQIGLLTKSKVDSFEM